MRVVCENCGATYKIPDTKLVKAVNKATCRKCGYKMMIQRPRSPGAEAAQASDPTEAQTVVKENPSSSDAELLEANTLVGQSLEQQEWSDEAPTQVQVPDTSPSPAPQVPPRKDIPHPDTTSPRVHSAGGKAPTDMLLALIGAFSSAGGALLLAVNTAGSPAMRFIGLGVALSGSLTTLFLLVTGNVGRQKGNIPLSIGLGTLLALGATGAIHVASGPAQPVASPIAVEEPVAAPEVQPAEIVADLVEETMEAADEIAEAAEEVLEEVPEEVVDALEEAVEDVAEVIPVAAPEVDRRAEEERQRKEEEARQRREEERRRAAESAPPPTTPAPPKLKSIPLSVVDTMIRTNLSIKRCFFQEKQRTGQLPRRVTVRFTVLPSGRVSTARMGTAEFQGGPLDSCLGRAFRSIQFPPFDGEPLNMTYPFVL